MPLPARPTLPLLSIVVPVFNEQERLPALYGALRRALEALPCRWEVILVDDGSQDASVAVWQGCMARDPRLSLVRLTRNFGKEPALVEGLRHARGDAVVPMDADLQDPPAVLEAFLLQWQRGHDMVYGVRRQRADPWWKRWSAAWFYAALRRWGRIAIPPAAGDFRLLDRTVVDRLLALPEVDRFTRGLYALVSARPCAVAYDRPARADGRRYRLGASIDQAVASLSFTDAPLQAVVALGLGCCLLGGGALGALGIAWLSGAATGWGWWGAAGSAVVVGVQLGAIGLVGLYAGRVLREVKRRPAALVAAVEGPIAATAAEATISALPALARPAGPRRPVVHALP